MSLINQMLHDLDERHASEQERAGLPRELRALPPARRFPWTAAILLLAGAALGGVGMIAGLRFAAVPVASLSTAAPLQAAPPALPELRMDDRLGAVVPSAPATTHPSSPRAVHKDIVSNTAAATATGAATAPPAQRDLSARTEAADNGAPARIDKKPTTPAVSDVAEAEYRKGVAALRRGAIVDGVGNLRNALNLDARHAAARQSLLAALLETQQYQEARQVAQAGLEIDPGQSGWAMILARLQVEQGDVPGAVVTLDHYAGRAERNADYQAFYALLLNRQQRPHDAAEHYRAALALRPNEGRWWYGLGLALEADQRPAEAREAYQRARASNNLPADLAGVVEQKLR
ncbi:MAG: tetratricopeptide repeat protein [Proteobacteria bacterium]|nr:tetratricopeptide repeat protein [Pseudomonadota bacterium]HQR04195.1 tetratricopeptide repeat protein [Rhodocyclaceae bacterium]